MGFLNKLFGFRWSLYVVQNGNQLVYAMHENSVMRIIGYVEHYFADGGQPVEPWSLYLNFNHKHQKIKLESEHFSPNDGKATTLLFQQIEAIDPDWKVKGAEPIFEEVATKKRIKIMSAPSGHTSLQELFDNIQKPREPTFYTVMNVVFGKK